MTTLEQTRDRKDRVAEKIKKVQELYADAPEIGNVALKNGLETLEARTGGGPGQSRAPAASARARARCRS